MPYDFDHVMRRDNQRCRLRYPDCRTQASTVVLHTAPFSGGTATDANARAACRPCAAELMAQRERAAQLLGGIA